MSYTVTSYGFRSVETGRFVSEEEGVTFTFFWYSEIDACPQCLSLNGEVFHDQTIWQDFLWSPMWGSVLNLQTGQLLTHGHTGINCRCVVEVEAEYDIAQVGEYTSLADLVRML